jgi:hypothetical protein
MIEAKVIADSIGEQSPRLLTIRATNPKFIHQETLRHRLIYIEDQLRGDFDFSFSVSSSRAIPFTKMLAEARDPGQRARPVKWGAEQRGMSMGDELTDDEIITLDNGEVVGRLTYAKRTWDRLALMCAVGAEELARVGAHKSIVNRVIENYIHVHCLMTATAPGWLNFFGLRLDKAADPTVRALAEACWVCWNEHEPELLPPGYWHLPFISREDEVSPEYGGPSGGLELFKKVSVARCARLSYTSFETGKRSTIEEDLALYERLITSRPIHASPAEHQATPDNYEELFGDDVGYSGWQHLHEAGNLGPGWRQYRKTLPDEAVADLPEEYR